LAPPAVAPHGPSPLPARVDDPPPVRPPTPRLSLHAALPISRPCSRDESSHKAPYKDFSAPSLKYVSLIPALRMPVFFRRSPVKRSEEHTSELQSRFDLVCRLLLEKKEYADGRGWRRWS